MAWGSGAPSRAAKAAGRPGSRRAVLSLHLDPVAEVGACLAVPQHPARVSAQSVTTVAVTSVTSWNPARLVRDITGTSWRAAGGGVTGRWRTGTGS